MRSFKSLLLAAFAAIALTACNSGSSVPEYPYPTLHGQITYFQEKDELYSTYKISKNDIVLVGDDLFDRGMWNAFYGSDRVKNRGIALEGTECTLYRIGKIAKAKPVKIFISTGLFDMKKGQSVAQTRDRILKIYSTALTVSPFSEVYVVGIVPDEACRKITERPFKVQMPATGAKPAVEPEGAVLVSLKDSIQAVNSFVAAAIGDKFIDLSNELCDSTGYIYPYFIVGENRINGAGYEVIAKALAPYIGLTPSNSIYNDPVMAETTAAAAVDTSSAIAFYSSWYNSHYSGRSAHYIARLSIFNTIPNTIGKTIMLGNSINNNCWWDELLGISCADIVNRGISGDVTTGILSRLDDINDENPARVFIMTGVNDFIEDTSVSVSSIWENYQKILSTLRNANPKAEIYVQSTLPMNPKSPYCAGRNEKVYELDSLLRVSESLYDYHYIDLITPFSDEEGNLKDELTADGIHLLPKAYYYWKGILKEKIR